MNTRCRCSLNAQGFVLLLKASTGTDVSAAIIGVAGSRGTQVITAHGPKAANSVS